MQIFARLILFVSVATAGMALSSVARADSRFGLGFILGDPTALSAKWYRDEERALDFQVAFFHDDYFLVYADHLYQYPGMFGGSKLSRRISPYIGVGPFAAVAMKKNHPKGNYFDERTDDVAVGVRVPFGIEWLWEKAPLGVGLELAPGVVVVPSTIAVLQGGLSLRYYF